jgi:GNAT superfamily N-acetyltransferase
MDTYELRRLTAQDWWIWCDARLAALRDSPAAFYSTLEKEQEYDQERWLAWMDPAWGLKTVALADTGPLGVVGGQFTEDVADAVDLYGMWVAPPARGSNLAAELVHEVIAWADEQGRKQVRLWVVEDNARAKGFYAKTGFRAVQVYAPTPRDPDVQYQLMTRPVA